MAAARRDGLIAIIPRVNAMNSFIRSESWRRHGIVCGGIAPVVYHYKREAILEAHRFGIASHQRTSVRTTCRDCGGSGKYTDWAGYTHPGCRRCASTGAVRLEFVETTLPGALWLSPREKMWALSDVQFDDLPETANYWEINQPGTDLTPSQVADHMCEIEAFFPSRPPKHWSDYGEHDPFESYTIWVGETQRTTCHLCGDPMEEASGMHCVRTGRIWWSAAACNVCRALHGADETFKALSRRLTQEFITPEIRRWIERHPCSKST